MWPFKKKGGSLAPEPPAILVFKSGRDFFEYQCLYGQTDIHAGRGIVALVLDAMKEFGTTAAVKVEVDGTQSVMLRVASADGGFVVIAKTLGQGEMLSPDDVVIWVPGQHLPKIGKAFGEDRSGWVGLIRAKVKPEFDVGKRGFTVLCEYK